MRRIMFACIGILAASVFAYLWGLGMWWPPAMLGGAGVGLILSAVMRPKVQAARRNSSGLCWDCFNDIHEKGMPCPEPGCQCMWCSPYAGTFDPDDVPGIPRPQR